MYEEDVTPLWEQHIDAKDRLRKQLYSQLYGREYEFASSRNQAASGMNPAAGFDMDLPEGVETNQEKEIKPFIPASSEADLMRVLREGPVN